MAQELQVIQDYYDLSLLLLKRVQLFPRNLRYGLGRSIEGRTELLLALLIRAKYSPRAEKLPFLQEFNLELEILRFQIRQAVELKAIPHQSQFALIEKMQAVGQQIGGWLKSIQDDSRK
jgi:hypothetical protein